MVNILIICPVTGGSITSVSSASGPPPAPSATATASTSGGGDLSLNLRGGSRGTSAPSSPAKSRESLLQRVQSLTGAARDQGANLLGEFFSFAFGLLSLSMCIFYEHVYGRVYFPMLWYNRVEKKILTISSSVV